MQHKISGGLYLVIDPAMGLEVLLPKLEQALAGGIDVLQVWNNWHNGQNKEEFVQSVCRLAHAHNIPVIINEEWQLLKITNLDGVHFDNIPKNYNHVKQTISKTFLCGITCGNDIERVEWANNNNLDYISFCSLFPSPSAGVCEIVSPETVRAARKITSLPIFLAGGITLENISELSQTGYNGIALISAIMKAGDTKQATEAFKNKLKTISHETITN